MCSMFWTTEILPENVVVIDSPVYLFTHHNTMSQSKTLFYFKKCNTLYRSTDIFFQYIKLKNKLPKCTTHIWTRCCIDCVTFTYGSHGLTHILDYKNEQNLLSFLFLCQTVHDVFAQASLVPLKLNSHKILSLYTCTNYIFG